MTTDERQVAAKVLRAMAHPVRLGILECLREGPMTVNELVDALDCGQSMASQQIKTLEYHGLVGCRRDGTHKYCSLKNRDVLAMLDCLRRHLYTHLANGAIGSRPYLTEEAHHGEA